MPKYALGAKRNLKRAIPRYASAVKIPTQVLTDISMLPRFNQAQQPACVGHAIANAVNFDFYQKTGIIPGLSPKWGYDVAKLVDGEPNDEGTSAGASIAGLEKYAGFATLKTVPNDVSLSVSEYKEITITLAITEDAKKFPISNDVEIQDNITATELISLITEYGVIIVAGSVDEDTWMNQNGNVSLLPGDAGLHEFVLFGFAQLPNNDVRFFVLNSWGSSWGNNGTGTFLWSDYQNNIFDAMSVQIAMDQNTKPQYTFSVDLFSGMTGPDVVGLQECLKYESVFPTTQECTGNFYSITNTAVIAFQKKYGIPETDYVGPLTRAKLNSLYGAPYTLVEALIQVESDGDSNAVGDENLPAHAYGCLQIRQPVCDDVNTHFNVSLKSQDMLGNVPLSIDTFNKYIQIYQPNGTDEEKARTWNGGPGYGSYTDAYWSKVQEYLGKVV